MTSVVAITNLLYTYGELMDEGDFAGAAALLGAATVRITGGQEIPGGDMLGIWQAMVILHDGGTFHGNVEPHQVDAALTVARHRRR